MRDFLWEREKDCLLRYFERKKKKGIIKWKHKKVDLYKHIEKITDDIKKKVLDLYMIRQKFYYTIRFFYWLGIYRGENFDEKVIEDFFETIRIRSA
jgi:hypothetical protein